MGEFFVGIWLTLTGFFLFGSWPFWIVLVLAYLIVWFDISHDRGLAAFFWIVTTALFVQFVAKFSIAAWFADNWLRGLRWIAIYLLLGLVYAVFRWYLHCRRKREQLIELEREFLAQHKEISELRHSWGADAKLAFLKFLSGKYTPDYGRSAYDVSLETSGLRPTFDRNMYSAGRWFWYWPWSLLGWLLDDFVREVYELVSRGLRGIMDAMSKRIFGDLSDLELTADERRGLQEEDDEHGRRRRRV